MVIAIDGPAGAGKSTVARALRGASSASPTSTRGRCIAASRWPRSSGGVDLDDADGDGRAGRALEIGFDGDRVALDGDDVSAAIREPRVTEASSRVSVHPAVREAMVARQRELIAAGRYVAEGRDIGTVVSPEAPLKVFLTASPRSGRAAAPSRPGEDPRRSWPPSASATPATRAASTAPCAPPTTRSSSTPPASTLDEVVDRVVALARQRGLA